MKISQLEFPEEYKKTHFRHKVGNKWYLIPLDARIEKDISISFECWLYNSHGKLMTGIPYQLTIVQLGLN